MNHEKISALVKEMFPTVWAAEISEPSPGEIKIYLDTRDQRLDRDRAMRGILFALRERMPAFFSVTVSWKSRDDANPSDTSIKFYVPTDGQREALDDPMYDEQNPVFQFARMWIERNGGEITRQLTMLLRDMDAAFVSRDQFALSIENRNQRIDGLEADKANLIRRVTDHEAREKTASDAVQYAADAINADQNIARIAELYTDNQRLAQRVSDLEQKLGIARDNLACASEELGERAITKRRERRLALEKLGTR